MSKRINVTEARAVLSELVVDAEDAPVEITRYGRTAALLVSPEAWERLHELLEDAEDRAASLERELRPSTEPTVPLDEVLTELGFTRSDVEPPAQRAASTEHLRGARAKRAAKAARREGSGAVAV